MTMATKQTEIPGTERPKIDEIDDKAEEYRVVRDERMRLSTKESEAKKAMITAMQNHGQTTYKYVDSDGNERTVKLETKVNAKVAKVKNQGGGGGDEVDATIQ